MDLSLLTNKGLLIKGFSTLSGISGASVGGWYTWLEINPSGYQQFFKAGYKYTPPSLLVDISKQIPKQLSGFHDRVFSPFEGINDGCFKNSFSNLSIGKSLFNGNGVTSDSRFSHSGSSSGLVTGCTVMKLAKDASNDKKFVFESQTLVKDDKTGIVVQAFSKNVKLTDDSNDESKLILQYTILFLENVSDNWSVKWGVVLNEQGDSVNQQLTQVTIKSPGGIINETFKAITGAGSSSIPTTWKEQNYSGIWIENNYGSTIFEKVIVAENKSKASILGNDGSFSGADDYASGTYLQTIYVYNNEESIKQWVPQTVSDFKNKLNNWFHPFKGKKGKWSNCQDKSSMINLDEKTKKSLKDYCFTS